MAGRLERPLLMAVDDDPGIRYTLRGIARYAGWTMVTFPDAQTALRWVTLRLPDAAIVDYHLPGESGLVLTRTLREQHPDLPIVVLTVDERQELADAFLAAGASDFALKPIRAPDLLARLRVHLRNRTRPGSGSAPDSGRPAVPGPAGLSTPALPKGIQRPTLEAVWTILAGAPQGATVEQVASQGGFGPATAYRYLRYLEEAGEVQVSLAYQPVGRPKKVYRLHQEAEPGAKGPTEPLPKV